MTKIVTENFDHDLRKWSDLKPDTTRRYAAEICEPKDGDNYTAYRINEYEGRHPLPSTYHKIVVYGDKALRDRIVELLNAKPELKTRIDALELQLRLEKEWSNYLSTLLYHTAKEEKGRTA